MSLRPFLAIVILTLSGPAWASAVVNAFVDLLVNGGNEYPWQKVELPGTKCSNGSQYKFWVHRTNSPNLLFLFEGGGACWDYDTCSGRAGKLGASNPNGIPDNYMTQLQAKYVSPLVNGADPGLPFRQRTDLPTKGWNIVYLPYCTGDVHIGNAVSTYADPTGQQPPMTVFHSGYTNTRAAAQYAKQLFPAVDKMLLTGYSAGGTASTASYYFVRNIIAPRQGLFLNDSGPIVFAPNVDDLSRPLHNRIRSAWNLDSVFSAFPAPFTASDLGSLNVMVSRAFPGDRFGYTVYLRDYNYSRFSYERFRTPSDRDSILEYWRRDQARFIDGLRQLPNFSFFVPYERQINDSHCSTVVTFVGSHACERMEKKRNWWEYLEFPIGQTYKCYSEFVPMETFLARFINEGRQTRIVEPANRYNAEDPAMKLISGVISAAL